ncbi:hypothetical protein HDU67_010029 [Dinochytrium kinnereticum]|nr:hypothetical protein HDU67_010029 [Dinochytrium kinnereticum]
MATKPPVDISTLTPDEAAFYAKYNRLPPAKKDILGKQLQGKRTYFDSGDYALSKAGKSSPKDVGSQHPSPERIPHSVPANSKHGAASSPVKESNLSNESSAVEGVEMEAA